jgi:hypothetical protein
MSSTLRYIADKAPAIKDPNKGGNPRIDDVDAKISARAMEIKNLFFPLTINLLLLRAFNKTSPTARNINIDPATLRIHVNILRGSSCDRPTDIRPIDINSVNSEM